MEILHDVDMKEYTTFRAGGRAKTMYVPDSTEELAEAVRLARAEAGRFLMLGNGSNTLVTDAGIRTPLIRLGPSFETVRTDGDRILAGAAALMRQTAQAALDAGLSGFENLSGIPGSVGGAVFMNAGAYGTEMKDVLVSVEAMKTDGSGQVRTVPASALDLSYRHSVFSETGEIVTEAVLQLSPADPEAIRLKMEDVTRRRTTKQPLNYPSAGSFFKRPAGSYASKLIEEAGLKGLSVGGAEVSAKHSGFIINRGGATAADILALMRLVRQTVYDRSGILLEPEIRIVGDDVPTGEAGASKGGEGSSDGIL